jgi:hypothetical protein
VEHVNGSGVDESVGDEHDTVSEAEDGAEEGAHSERAFVADCVDGPALLTTSEAVIGVGNVVHRNRLLRMGLSDAERAALSVPAPVANSAEKPNWTGIGLVVVF